MNSLRIENQHRPEIEIVANAGALAHTAAARVIAVAQESVEDHGRFTIALSGGSTPELLCSLLTRPEYRDGIDWGKTFVFWGDERTVSPDDPESNFCMARDSLLDYVPIPRDQIFRMRGEIDPEVAAREYEQALRQTFDLGPGEMPVFDLVMLGIGSDGHTASLFPHTDALHETERLTVANKVPQLDTTRITITTPVIQAADNVLMLVSGAAKAEAVQLALEGEPNYLETPSQLLREARGRVIWLIDEPAAAELSRAPSRR